MKAIILAAGIGRRLGLPENLPKSLISFNGKSLMQRHIDNLVQLGIKEICLCLGYEQDQILNAIRIPGEIQVSSRFNPDYREGSMISLWTMRDDFINDDVILMDADVLYDSQVLGTLVENTHPNALLMDRHFEAGDEPVKICINDGEIVEFRKNLADDLAYDTIGESVGFFRFAPETGRILIDFATNYLDTGGRDLPCEEAIRDTLLAEPAKFHVCDVTGKRWIEIDFPEDIARAEREILPFAN